MAIKVIYRGQLPENEIFSGTCYNCKSKIECNKKDGVFSSARSQVDESYVSVSCPVCGKSISAYSTGRYSTEDDTRYGSSLASQISAVESGHGGSQWDR